MKTVKSLDFPCRFLRKRNGYKNIAASKCFKESVLACLSTSLAEVRGDISALLLDTGCERRVQMLRRGTQHLPQPLFSQETWLESNVLKAALFLLVAQAGAGLNPQGAMAQSAPKNLDLSSTSATEAASRAGTITVGGNAHQVKVGDLITPAERVALAQVFFNSGNQSIVLGAQGNAVGGTLNLSYAAANGATNLVIPHGVVAVQDAGRLTNLSLTGNLLNSGTLQVISQNSAISSASISASNITNMQGGLITSILPASGLAGYTPALNSLNLSLNAIHNITNMGIISSSAALNLSAGGAISNLGSGALIQAKSDLGMIASYIQNTALMQSLAGNINIASTMTGPSTAANMVLDFSGGTLEALKGSINIGDVTRLISTNINVNGGNFLSQQLNFGAGYYGDVLANVGQVSGTVNAYVHDIQLNAVSNQLSLGTIEFSHDPIITQQVGNDIIVLQASSPGNITFQSQGNLIIQCDVISTGGFVNLISGQNITAQNISSANLILIDAKGSITTGNINAPGSVFVHGGDQTVQSVGAPPSGGNVSVGVVTTPSVTLQSDNGTVNYQSITAQSVGLQANTSSLFAPNVSAITFSGSSPNNNGISVFNMGTGGVAINQVLTVPGNSSQGGSIDVEAAKGPVFINADLTANTGTKAGALSGSIILSSGSSITLSGVNLNARGSAGNTAGSVSITSNNLIVTGNSNVNVDANGGTGGGSAFVSSYAANNSLLVSGGGKFTVNADAPSGSSINLSAGALQIDPTTSVYMHADGNSSVFANNVNVIASGGPASSLSMGNGPGQLQVSSNSAPGGGGGGMVYVSSSGDLMVNSGGVSASADASSSSSGGSITLAAGGSLRLNSSVNLNGSGSGNGGSLTMTAANSITNSGTLSFSATAGSSGKSGSISAQSNGSVALTNVSFDASNSGSGSAGSVSISAGSDLNMSSASISTNSAGGAGGNISVLAGKTQSGVLSFDGNMSADGAGTASGGTISLGQSAGTAMQLGIQPVQGQAAAGVISASCAGGTGGTLNISGGASSDLNVALNETISLKGASVDKLGTLKASSTNKISISGPASLIGSISGSAASYSVVVSGAGSTVGVTSVKANSGNVTVKASAADSSLVFAAGSSINAPAGAIEIGAPEIQFRGNSTLSMDTAGILKINSGNQTSSLNMDFANASKVTFNVTQGTSLRPGNIQIGPNGNGSLSLNSAGTTDLEFTGGTGSLLSSGGNVNLGAGITINSNVFDSTQNLGVEIIASNGDININSGISARQLNVSTVVAGNINFAGDLMAPTVVLSTQGNGSINQTASGGNIGIGTLIMSSQAGNIGSSTQAISANVLELKVNSGGSVFVNNASSVDIKTSTVAGNFQLNNQGDVSMESNVSAGSLNIIASGNISMFAATSGTNGVTLSAGSGKSIHVAPGASLGSTAGAINISTDNLVLDGAVSALTQVAVNSNATLNLSGTNASISASGNGALISLSGTKSVSFATSYILNAGASGIAQVQTASLSSGGVVLAGGASVTAAGGSQLNIFTNALSLGSGSSISLSNAGNAMSVVSTAGAPLSVNLAAGATNTITSTAGGTVQFVAGTGAALVFQSSGVNAATLSVSGGNLNTTSSAADTSLSNVNLSSSRNINVAVNGGTLHLNGNITSTQGGGVIVLQDPNGITIAGNGTVGFASGLSGTINVQALTPAAVLEISGAPVFNAGSAGTLSFSALGQIVFDNSSQVKISAAAVNMNAPSIVMGAKSQVAAVTAANFNMSGINGSSLNIVIPAAGSASFSSAGGQFNINTVSGSAINFVQSSVSSSASTLNFSGAPLNISTANANITINPNVVLSSDSNISVQAPGGSVINNGLIQGANNTTVISQAGNLIINQAINAYSLLIQTTANNGTITLSANINVTRDLTISANGSGNIFQKSGLLTADSITLISGSGNIGSSTGRIQLKANSLSVSTTGAAFINAQGPVSVSSYNVGGGLNLSASGNISIGSSSTPVLSIVSNGVFDAGRNGTVSINALNTINIASGVSIQSKNSALNISAAAISAGNGVRIKADGNLAVSGKMTAGNELRMISNSGSMQIKGSLSGINSVYLGAERGITFDANVSAGRLCIEVESSGGISQLSGSLKANRIELEVERGNIGSSQKALNVQADSLEISCDRGLVNISAAGKNGNLVTLEESYSLRDFTLVSAGSLSVGDVVSLNGSVSLTASGSLQVQESGTVVALQGNVTLRSSNAANGSILIGQDANIVALSDNAGSGNVYVLVGSMPTSLVNGTRPSNVSVSELFGGNVYFGKNGITVNGSENSINGWGSNVVFSAASRSQITLDGGVFILADPPVQAAPVASLGNLAGSNAGGTLSSPIAASVFHSVSPAISQPLVFNSNLSLPVPVAGLKNIYSQVKGSGEKIVNSEVNEELKPIACVTRVPALGLQNSAIEAVKNAGMSSGLICAQGSEYTIDAAGVSFKKGEMLVDSATSSTIRTGYGTVEVSRGACVLLKSNGKGLELFNLHENRWGCVKVKINNREFVLGVGQTLNIDQESRVAVRNGETHWVSNKRVNVAEFNLVSLHGECNLLSALTRSQDKEHKQISSRIYKTAACLSVVTASHGPYKN